MELIRITEENIDNEHICCAISNNGDCQVASKKAWLKERFKDGLVFLRGDVRGKCFIEYIPAENAWAPLYAEGWMYIDCLWVSGQFKGHGYSNLLLEECIRDSKQKGKKGLVTLSSEKKLAFLSDPEYLKHKGFTVSDAANPQYTLMCLPFSTDVNMPKFKDQVRKMHIDEAGFVLYYSSQCPFTAKYAPLIEETAKAYGASFKAVHFETAQQAQSAPAPFTAYSLFYDGDFVTNEIMSVKKFEKLLEEKSFKAKA